MTGSLDNKKKLPDLAIHGSGSIHESGSGSGPDLPAISPYHWPLEIQSSAVLGQVPGNRVGPRTGQL